MNKIKSLKNIFHTSGTKHGAYSVGLTVLVIAVVIVLDRKSTRLNSSH